MPALGTLQQAVYAAEAEALDRVGRRWRRVTDVQRYLDDLIRSTWFFDQWPTFLRATIERRGRGSVWSTHEHLDHAGDGGSATEGVILVADRALHQAVVLHELSHLLRPAGTGHDDDFALTELTLVRHEMGFFAFADYLHALQRSERFPSLRATRW